MQVAYAKDGAYICTLRWLQGPDWSSSERCGTAPGWIWFQLSMAKSYMY